MSASLKPGPAGPQTWGEVHAHQRVMRYRHSGAGPAVVLLGADAAAFSRSGDLWPELPSLLQAHFRVVIPQLPADVADVAISLECLLDGVGATGIGVIAGGPYCYPAVELALSGRDYVSRLVLVGDGNTNEASPADSAVSNALQVPLMVLSRRLTISRVMDLAVPFLRGIMKR